MKENIINPHDSATQWLETYHITQYVRLIGEILNLLLISYINNN